MKVLVVTPTCTHPADQGNRVRVHQISQSFKNAGAELDLLYYALDGVNQKSLESMRRAWDSVILVALRGFRPRRSSPRYWGVDDWVSPSLIETVRALAASVSYDAVIVNYVWCSAILECFPRGSSGPLRIIDTHDAFGQRRELMQASGLEPHWFYTNEADEARGLDRADIVVAIQSQEAEYFRGLTRSDVRTIAYMRPAEPVAEVDVGNRPLRVGYVGSANPWNVRSVEMFDAALDEARDRFPEGRMPEVLIFGNVADKLAGMKHCVLMGPVVDVADVYARVDIMVNPMVGGTGLKIKTVESLSYGLPILSTLAGGVGLDWLHPDLALADMSALVNRLAELATAPERVARLQNDMNAAYRSFEASVDVDFQTLLNSVRRHAALRIRPV